MAIHLVHPRGCSIRCFLHLREQIPRASMKKPTLYFDTSVISAYWYEGADVAMLARRMHTREWWDSERKQFSLWASTFGEAELQAGHFPRQRECLKMIRRIRYLTVTNSVKDLMDEILERGLVPETKPGDAAHLAISTSHGIDYLLTWNYAHMANANVQDRLNSLCDELDLVALLMVSPESIPQ
jgi:hypothetical protein